MSLFNTLAIILLVCAAVQAFTIHTSTPGPATTALQAGRRDFLHAAMSATAGLVVASIPGVALAEDVVDDLSMPSEEEQKKAEEAAMQERLRRKAELQKQKSTPMSFSASLAKEKEKQKSMQMTKEQRRDELCETLGRGC